MNKSIPAAILLLLCLSSASCSFFGKKNAPKATPKPTETEQMRIQLNEQEIRYLSNRDECIQKLKIQYKKYEREKQNLSYSSLDSLCQLLLYNPDRKFLLDLEKQLKEILRGSKFPSRGKINLETLLDGDIGMGMLDALKFGDNALTVAHTTRPLFLEYLNKEKMTLPLENLDSETLRRIFQCTFSSDAAISNLSDLKLISENGIQAYGMLGLESQGDGFFFANNVFVMVVKGNYVYLVRKELAQEYNIRNKCVSWYREEIKSDTLYTMVDRIWNQYCACCRQELKKDKKFADIQALMTKLANELAN